MSTGKDGRPPSPTTRRFGYEDLKAAFGRQPAEIVEEVKRSGLRGRGGAGFPAGVKWGFINPKNPAGRPDLQRHESNRHFKDRYIIHQDPHQPLEGMVISCFAGSAPRLHLSASFPRGAHLEQAIASMQSPFLGKNIREQVSTSTSTAPGSGSLHLRGGNRPHRVFEGKRAYPRIKPPYFPAVLGLYMCPTIVNNVETLCHVKHIIAMGGAEYGRIGRPNNTGTRIVCVSGDVVRPGYFEIEVGALTMGR
jgi:NADH-quinone oxidoreductase subunit F